MKKGFTAIELLVTLFIAAMALATGYQLYAAIIKESSETRTEVAVGNVAYESIKRYRVNATAPCTSSIPANNVSRTIEGVGNVRLTVVIQCANTNLPNLSSVTASITYGSPEKTITHGSYITPGEI